MLSFEIEIYKGGYKRAWRILDWQILKLFWFELQIKIQWKYHLPFLPASQPSVWCCKIVVIEGLSKFMSFLQKNRTIDWNVATTHWCKPLQQGFVLLFVCSSFHLLSFQWWILKSFKDFFFVFLPSSKSTTMNTELVRNIFIRPTLFKFLQCFILYFQSHFMMLPFCGYFYRVSHQQLNSNKFKDFKTFEYYGIWIETFELTTVKYWGWKN